MIPARRAEHLACASRPLVDRSPGRKGSARCLAAGSDFRGVHWPGMEGADMRFESSGKRQGGPQGHFVLIKPAERHEDPAYGCRRDHARSGNKIFMSSGTLRVDKDQCASTIPAGSCRLLSATHCHIEKYVT